MSKRIVTGLGKVANQDNIKGGIIIDKEEEKFLENEKRSMPSKSDQLQLRKEIAHLANKLEMNLPQHPDKKIKLASRDSSSSDDSSGSDDSSKRSNSSSDESDSRKKKKNKKKKRSSSSSEDESYSDDSKSSSSSDDSDESSSSSSSSSSSEDLFGSIFGGSKSSKKHHRRSKHKHGGSSKEERIRRQIGSVFASDSSDIYYEERDRDTKARYIERIQFLKQTLEDAGHDISYIEVPSINSSLDKIIGTARILEYKDKTERTCNIVGEASQWMALIAGEIFNGERTFFGRYQPNLEGWNKEVAFKFERSKPMIAESVGRVIQDNHIGSGLMLLTELIISAATYSTMKRNQKVRKSNEKNDNELPDGDNNVDITK